MLAWLMEEAKGEEKTARALTKRILLLNLAAIHTTNMVSCRDGGDILKDEANRRDIP